MRKKFYLLFFALFFGGMNRCFSQALPIKPGRTISFTMHEGSYMNLDVSPDGKTLVFDLLSDLYTLSVSGGNATQLTHGLALYIDPNWSPDGKMIAYITDESGAMHLAIRDISGEHQRIIDAPGNQFNMARSPYPAWAGRDYLTINSSDGLKVNALQEKDKTAAISFRNAIASRISPDGQDIEFISRFRSSDSLCRYNLRLRSTRSISPVVLPADVNELTLSPDLQSLAYVTDSAGQRCLFIRAVTDKGPGTLLTALNAQCPSPEYLQSRYCFSPDSRTIYISYGGKIHGIDVQTGSNRIIPFTVRVRSDLGAFNYHTFRVSHAPFQVKYTRSAVAGPDGKRLAFSALNRLYIMNLPNGKPRLLSPQPVSQYQPCWSPDGKWIVYVSWCDTTGGYLWKVPARGGRAIQLTAAAGQYQRPCWSPDGKQVAVIKGGPIRSIEIAKQVVVAGSQIGSLTTSTEAYAKGGGKPQLSARNDDAGIGQLQLVDANSGVITALADSVPLWNQLAFSKDGQSIIYEPALSHPNDNSAHRIPMLISTDKENNHTEVLAIARQYGYGYDSAAPLGWFLQRSLSPDKRYLVYSRGEDLYLEPVKQLPVTINDPGQKLTIIRFAMGVDPHWEQGGKVLSWSYGNRFFRINPDKILAAAKYGKVQKAMEIKDNDIIAVHVRPGQVIKLNITAPAFYAHGTVALTNARIITMQGNQVIEKGTILIRNGRFAAVGNSSIVIPKDAKIYDLASKTIIPGFVDLHLHMYLPPDVFPQQAWQYLANLAYGVTTARDPSSSYDSFGYTELLQSGQMTGPRLFSSGRPIRLTEGIRVDNLEDALRTVAKRKLMGGTFMKQYTLPTRLQRQWLLLASKADGLNMTNEGGEGDPLLDFAQLKDGSSGTEHNPDPWGDARKDVITLFAKSGTWFTPTLQVRPDGLDYFDSKYWHPTDTKMERFLPGRALQDILKTHYTPDDSVQLVHDAQIDAAIRKAGGRVTMGSHGNNEGIGPHNELWALQMGGLTNLQALQAATIMGAEGLGIQKDVGSIAPGKIADLIILNKNPLDDIHNSREIKYVMKDGVLYDGDTLDELWPKYKKCPEWRLHEKQAR